MNRKLAISLATALCAVSVMSAWAQGQYKPGDRIQVMWNGKLETGTVMPMAKLDLDKSGRVLRVKLDCLADFLQPEGTEVMARDVRGAAPQQGGANDGGGDQAGGPGGNPGGGPTGTAGGGGNYKPGDRVTAMWNGKQVTGTVVPFANLDLDKTGRVLRVKIDGLADFLQPEGTEIMARDIKGGAGAPAAPAAGNGAAHHGGQNNNNAANNNGNNNNNAGAPRTPPPAANNPNKNFDRGRPTMNGNAPNIVGTAWKMLYDVDVNVVPVIRFTHRMTYDTVRYALGAGLQGKYSQNGSTLYLNGEPYQMNYNAGTNIMMLTGGRETLKLLYNGTVTD